MTSQHISVEFAPRRRGHAPSVATVALMLAFGAGPLVAQQRVEVKMRTPRAEANDSTQQTFRRLQRTLDSLTRIYNESEDLSVADRRRIEMGLSQTVTRLEALADRMNETGSRADELVRLRLAPGMAERASASMAREMMQVRDLEAAAPRGWIGIVTQGAGTLPRLEDGQMIVRYWSYPRIVSVDPSSPAQRAGLVPNDTLVAYDGRDVRENDISLTRLLRPNARVVVRVRRDGRTRDFPVTVAAAPTRIAQRRDDEARGVQPEQWVVAGVPEGAMFPRTPMPAMPASPAVRPMAGRLVPTMTAPSAPGVAPTPSGFVFSFTTGGVAGAQLTTITEGLARTIGVTTGVLVTSAPVGSPANESGIMDGDVIVKVEGQNVRNVAQVRSFVAMAAENGDRSVDVELLRQKKTVKIQLKW